MKNQSNSPLIPSIGIHHERPEHIIFESTQSKEKSVESDPIGSAIGSDGKSLAGHIWLAILCLLLMTLSGCAVLNPTMPIQIPIDLSKAGSVAEAEFWIPADDSIELCLYFFVNDQPGDSKRLHEFLGAGNESNITTPLKVQIKKKITSEKYEVWMDKTYPSTTPGGAGRNYYYQDIVNLSIKSGSYRLRVESIRAIPQFAQNRVEVRVYYFRRK